MVPGLESTLFVLLTILAIGLAIPDLFKKFQIPFVTSIILAGAILGPNLLNYIKLNSVIEFFGFLGMTFLMLMAGLGTDLSKIKDLKKQLFIMFAFNGLIPFFVGLSITLFFGYSYLTALLVGIIFISSSIALSIPALESIGIVKRKAGQLILSAVFLADAISLVLLSFLLQNVSPITSLPLPVYFLVLVVSIGLIAFLLPRITNFLFKNEFKKTDHEEHLRFVIIVLIAVLAYFSVLGVHPILGAFIVGVVLANIIDSEEINTKLHTLGYGIFVPVFFFIVGMEMNLSIFFSLQSIEMIIIVLVSSLIISKLVTGYISGRLVGLSSIDASVFGITSIVQLTTTLAVTYAASSIGLLDSTLVTAIVMLSVITSIIGPLLLKLLFSFSAVEEKM